MSGMQRDQSQDADIQQTEQLEPHKEPEVNQESPSTGESTEANASQRSHFFAVANALMAAIDPNSPELVGKDGLTKDEAIAIKMIFEAKTSKETEQSGGTAGGRVSALERMRYLQLGLAKLQSPLALARNPAFTQGRGHIEEIRKRIARLKDEINQAILDEEKKNRDEKSKKPGVDEDKASDEEKKKKSVDITMSRK